MKSHSECHFKQLESKKTNSLRSQVTFHTNNGTVLISTEVENTWKV